MIRRSRLIAALAVAAMCAPGTWLRSAVSEESNPDIAVARIQGEASTSAQGWSVEGVWEYSAAPSLRFGGFSALFTLGDSTLRAFSDRGFRFTFTVPDEPANDPRFPKVSRQAMSEERLNWVYWDIESATRDPETGDYWLGYEYEHAIHRFSIASQPESFRSLEGEVGWGSNSGLEAMERLSDGRFLAIPEGKDHALIYPSDPVEGGEPRQIRFESPAESFAVTDLAQLPDGRVLLLMRNVAWGTPPFEGLIAIADAPAAGSQDPWSPRAALRFDGVIPRENYEGLAVRAQEDGTVIVWIISDDNISAFQRTLLAKLIFDPSA